MPLVFSVTNAAKSPLTLQLLGRTPTADFVVSDVRGGLVWSLLKGQIMAGSLRLYPLAPGRRLRFRAVWRQRSDKDRPVAPGEYLIRGVLLTDTPGGLASAPARLRIEG